MRVLFGSLVAMSALVLAACSGGTEDSTLQRQRATGDHGTSAGTKTSDDETAPATTPPASPSPQPSPEPSPATPDAGTTPPAPPAPTPATPGSCGAPKCFGLAGIAGCKATDGAGDLVTMGCQDGACACFSGGQTTAEFNGDVNSGEEAAQLFLANCTCN